MVWGGGKCQGAPDGPARMSVMRLFGACVALSSEDWTIERPCGSGLAVHGRVPWPGMKILISADMEGATGVTWPADVLPGTPQWERCRAMFTSDVNAAALGFYDGGADEVLVNEAHWSMRNLLLERLDDRVQMLTGRHKSLSMVEGIQHGDIDAIAFVGYHTGAGAEGSSPTRIWRTPSPGSGSTAPARARDCSTHMSWPSTGCPSSSSPATT